MDAKKAERVKLISIIVVAGLVASASLLFAKVVFDKGQTIEAGIALAAGLVLLAAFSVFTFQKYREIEKGEPLADERTSKLGVLAGYRAFMMSLYWLLAIGYMVEDSELLNLDVSGAIGLGIIGMTVIFGLNYLYLIVKGDPGEK